MKKDSVDFLLKFLAEPSPSGHEMPAAAVFRKRLENCVDQIDVDVMGNSIAVLNPKADFKVMLAGHYDEVGLQIAYIDERGLMNFRAAGGVTRQALPATEVEIIIGDKRIPGVIGCKPIHFMDAAERERAPEIKNMWIDIGVETKKEVEALGIYIGAPVAVKANAKRMGKHRIMSKGLDDKIGAFIVAEVMRKLADQKKKLKIGVYGVGTVQEELGLRGAHVSAFGVNPNVGFCIDVSFTTDTPDMDKKLIGDLALGKGPILVHNADNNLVLAKRIRHVANTHKLNYQETAGRGASGGNDTSAMQMTRSGVATASFGIPNRYMHSPAEMVDIRDVETTIYMIVETILSFKGSEQFRPGIDS